MCGLRNQQSVTKGTGRLCEQCGSLSSSLHEGLGPRLVCHCVWCGAEPRLVCHCVWCGAEPRLVCHCVWCGAEVEPILL